MVLGDWLAAGRVSCGFSLEQFAPLLRIQQFYLEALEREDFDSLPARPYVSGYVRSYALRASLDPAEANRRLQQVWPAEIEPIQDARALQFADAGRSRKLTVRRAAAAVLVASIAGYAAWYFETVRERQPAALSPVAELEADPAPQGVPANSAQQLPNEEPRVVLGPLAPVSLQQMPADYLQQYAAGQQGGEQAVAYEARPEGPFPRPRPGTPAAIIWAKLYGPVPVPDDLEDDEAAHLDRSANKPSVTRIKPSMLSAYLPKLRLRSDLGPLDAKIPAVVMLTKVDQPESTATIAEPVPRARTQAFAAVPPTDFQPNAGAGTNRIVLAAAGAPSWVEIRDAAGTVVMSRLLKTGESVPVPKGAGLKLTTGNASALTVILDGETLPSFGKKRRVVRGIPLDPDQLRARLN